ncbi:MAG: SPOR domain-containing protein [Marinilabiliales bacterium]|nr:SPOR domain-containing protein [Marinilabiliales bacterium]
MLEENESPDRRCLPYNRISGTPDRTTVQQRSRLRIFSPTLRCCPSPAYSEKNPVPVDFTMPPGLVYTVQIAAFRNPVAPSLFRGLYPVFGSKRPGSDATYYYTGLFRRLDDARQALPGARGAGFPDAFVVAMMDGTQVSMERAQLLEKQWAAKPLPGQGGCYH